MIELGDFHATDFPFGLARGMAWCLYCDDGPDGPCGQSIWTTCPHASLMIWSNEDAMRSDLEGHKWRNKKHRLMFGVVGEWTCGGVFHVDDRTGGE